jgi:hypothetical protein
MSWEIYRWDDASAPTLNATASSLVNVLDAVLVNGYGAKSAAGWSKPFTGTNKAAFLQGTGSLGMYLRVDNPGTAVSARVAGYETMSDVDTGTQEFPAIAGGGGYLFVSSTTDATARPWLIAADSKRFFMLVGYNVATSSFTGAVQSAYFFGDTLPNNPGDAYSVGLWVYTSATQPNAASGMGTTTQTTFTAANFFTPRTHTGAATVVNNGFANYVPGLGNASTVGRATTPYPDPVTGGMILSPYYYGTTNVLRGRVPGFWVPSHSLPAAAGDTFTGSAVGGLAGKSFVLYNIYGAGALNGRFALETSDTVED